MRIRCSQIIDPQGPTPEWVNRISTSYQCPELALEKYDNKMCGHCANHLHRIEQLETTA